MTSDSESFLVTVPTSWDLQPHSMRNRKFPNVQDFIRELIRRDIEDWDKQQIDQQAKK